MPFDKTALANLGGTEPHKGEFRAHLQFRDDKNTNIQICGPSRTTEEEAQKDLDQVRAAGGVGSTREESLKIMMAEAQRIKLTAEYKNQIQKTIQRRTSLETIEESDCEEDDDMSVESDPPWIKEYLTDDDSPDDPQTSRPILTPLGSTAELTKLRPVYSTPSELKHLLECKADPNMRLETGDITPLRKVMSFAPMKCGGNEESVVGIRW